MILSKMNTRNTKRATGSSVFGGNFGAASGAEATTTGSTFGSYTNSLFGEGSQKPSVFGSLFGGGAPGTNATTGSLFGSTCTKPPAAPGGASTFGAKFSDGSGGAPPEAPKSPTTFAGTPGPAMFGAYPGVTPGGAYPPAPPPAPPPETPRSPTLFGSTPAVNPGTAHPTAVQPAAAPPTVVPAPPVGSSMFGTATAETNLAAGQSQMTPGTSLFGATSSLSPLPASQEALTALQTSIDNLTKKVEESERTVIKYHVVCGIHCHPLTEMVKDELGGPYVNGFQCIKCQQVQRDFSERYYHCTVCPTDPQRGGTDFCCHCVRSFLAQDMQSGC